MTKKIEMAYPMCKLPDETAVLYLEELTVLADEVGRDRAEQAVNNALRFCKYFPTIAEIRNVVPAKRQSPWQTPTAEEMAEAEEARKSPEAQKFFALLRKIKTEKTMGRRMA